MIKQAAGGTAIIPPAGKRGRVKKNTSAKSTSGTKAPVRPRKTKQQSTVAAKEEQLSLDDADHDDELDQFLNDPRYTTQTGHTELADIPEYSTQAPDAEDEVPTLHNNADELGEEV